MRKTLNERLASLFLAVVYVLALASVALDVFYWRAG